jgi:hypothetical protein
VYIVLSGFTLVGCILIQISVTLSDMSDDLPPHPNIVIELHLCLYMSYEIDVDADNYLYHKLIDYTCMLNIGCKPMMLSTSIWLKLDKKCLMLVVVSL